jgi:hypothetical protein
MVPPRRFSRAHFLDPVAMEFLIALAEARLVYFSAGYSHEPK